MTTLRLKSQIIRELVGSLSRRFRTKPGLLAYCVGWTGSFLGDEFQFATLPWVVLQITRSAAAVGRVLISRRGSWCRLNAGGWSVTYRFSPRQMKIAMNWARSNPRPFCPCLTGVRTKVIAGRGHPKIAAALGYSSKVLWRMRLLWALFRRLHKASWAHVCPVRLDPVQTDTSVSFGACFGPSCGHLTECRPQRILSFVIHQDKIFSVFIFKWICHTRCSPSVKKVVRYARRIIEPLAV
jgi:hypothetical protein